MCHACVDSGLMCRGSHKKYPTYIKVMLRVACLMYLCVCSMSSSMSNIAYTCMSFMFVTHTCITHTCISYTCTTHTCITHTCIAYTCTTYTCITHTCMNSYTPCTGWLSGKPLLVVSMGAPKSCQTSATPGGACLHWQYSSACIGSTNLH